MTLPIVLAVLGVGGLAPGAPAVAADQPGRPGDGPNAPLLCAMRTPSRIVLAGTAAAAPSASQDTPASQLRITLGRLLGEHTYLTMETMRAVALRAPDLAALRAALDGNSGAMSAAIGSVYGDVAARQFGALWQRHVDLLLAYATAKRDGDDAGEQQALDGLAAFKESFAAFLAAANPAIDAQAEAEALQIHVSQLIAFVQTDYGQAYAAEREAFRHMFAFGDHLALAITNQFPDRYRGGDVAFSPAADLRVTLDRLLAEHLVLAAEAMRARLADASDADAARQTLSANTADLSSAVARYYGDAAGRAFQELWSKHIQAYLGFVDAVATHDDSARQATLDTLHAYHDELARFLADANPYVDGPAVAALIQRHVQALIAMVEADAAGDAPRAVSTIADAYARMFDVGDALAAATVREFPGRFRDLRDLPPTSTLAPATPARDGQPFAPGGLLVAGLLAGLLAATSRRARVTARSVIDAARADRARR